MRSQGQRRASRGAEQPYEASICPHDSCCHKLDQTKSVQSWHFRMLDACNSRSTLRPRTVVASLSTWSLQG